MPCGLVKLATRDVRRVERHARTLIRLGAYGQVSLYRRRRNYIDIVAVVGPGRLASGQELPEALLMEIGVGHARPYRFCQMHKHGSGKKSVGRRWHHCRLTEEQYLAVTPVLWRELERINRNKVRRWQSGDQLQIRLRGQFFTIKRGMEQDQWERWFVFPRGSCFSVSWEDELFLRDLFWMEFDLFARPGGYLRGMINFLDKMTVQNRRYDRKRPLTLERFQRHQNVQMARGIVQARLNSSLPPYLLIESLNYLRGNHRNHFWDLWRQLFERLTGLKTEEHWLDGKGGMRLETRWSQLARNRLSHPERRMKGLATRVVSQVGDRGRRRKDFLTFMLFKRPD